MRVDVPTQARYRPAGGLGLALIALAIAATASGQEPAPAPELAGEPVALSADRVRFWDDGPTRWVLLDGRASVFQGPEGLLSDRAVVRIDRNEEDASFRLSIYSEGRVRPPAGDQLGIPAKRWPLSTKGEVRLQALAKGGAVQLKAEPAGEPLLARAFPNRARNEVKAQPPAPPAQPAAPPVQPPAAEVAKPAEPAPKVDEKVEQAQFGNDDVAPVPLGPELNKDPAPADMPDRMEVPDAAPLDEENAAPVVVPPSEIPPLEEPIGPAPVLPENRRVITIGPRDSGPNFTQESFTGKDGTTTTILRGGVNVISEEPGRGTVDMSADSIVIWSHPKPNGAQGATIGAGTSTQEPTEALEIYGEGNVIFRQDERKTAGDADQKIVKAKEFFFDFQTQNFLGDEAEASVFSPGLIAPLKVRGDSVRQFRPLLGSQGGKPLFGQTQIRADRAVVTGSRFPIPGYRFQAKSVDLKQKEQVQTDPLTGQPVGNPNDPRTPQADVWRIDSRQNIFYIGPVPAFYWPRFLADSDDLDPPLRNIQFHTNNYFGQQFLSDWSMFKLLGLRKPTFIDNWNLDIDYLSYRGLGAGSEIGWFGKDLIGDLTDPYHRTKSGRDVNSPYFGYLDIWGLRDSGRDVLGPGPAIITNGPPGAGKRGYQRTSVPAFQQFRGRYEFRHMQSFLGPDAPEDEDLRLQLETGYASDRYFLEEYYKRLFDSGLDQGTLAYGIYQKQNRAFTLLTSANLQPWYTDTQWFPKLDYYRLGDSFLGNLFSYSQNSGVDYANTHTDVAVNNPHIFAFQPFDPVSATSGPFRTGRAWTSHELAMPLDFQFLRVVPYAQGQLVGWDNQYQNSLPNLQLNGVLPNTAFIRGPQGAMLGRAWGAVGARANIMAWRTFPGVESELLNVHGLAHKINFDADFRTSYSNVGLNRIGIQDQLDDNSYELVRRYFALTNYFGGVLPPQFDPRYLTLRRTMSPITGTTDVQAGMETLQLGIRQRLQTKRGPDGRRRVIDWMILDVTTTYFPNAQRDNFGKPFGQNQYNYEWFIGDRTSIVSYGWFEFWNITGKPILLSNPRHTNDPFGLSVITSGISIARPPRANVFIGYSVINTGPISTSALNTSLSYWMSPKWYGSFSTMYDFGNGILLGSTFSLTKIGADFLTSVGLTVDPQRMSYTFGFELTPRLSPGIRMGSTNGPYRFDSRFAATQ